MLGHVKGTTFIAFAAVLVLMQCETAPDQGTSSIAHKAEPNTDIQLISQEIGVSGDDGLDVDLVLSNSASLPVCTAPDLIGEIYVEVRDRSSGLRVLSQRDRAPTFDFDNPPEVFASRARNRKARARVVQPGDRVSLKFPLDPLVEPYLVDASQNYAGTLSRAAKIDIRLSISMFDCKYKSLGVAATEGAIVTVSTSWLKAPDNASKFLTFY